jgi:ABC-type transporter Mla MlaB component
MAKKDIKSTIIDPGIQITIDNIHDLLKKFNSALKNNQSIEIKNEMLENIDLTGIQFLYYAKKKSEAEGKKIHIDIKLTENMKALIQNSGFSTTL